MHVIKKILNNNVVIAENNNKEVILVGKAIGYDLKKGMSVPEDRIKSIFVKQKGESGHNYERLLQNVDNEVIGVSEEIISMCEKELNVKLNDAIHLSLTDHINFALQRVSNGVKIENPFFNELKVLYPKEFEIAYKALEMINKRFDNKLPEDEVGFICLHIRAAIMEQDVSKSLVYTKKIKEIMDLIQKLLKKEIDRNSFEYIRTLTHINFMLERIKDKKTIKNELLNNIKKEMFYEYNVAIKVALKIENVFQMKVPEDEIGYIALHLRRLSEE